MIVCRVLKVFLFIVLLMVIGCSFDIYLIVSIDIVIGLFFKLFGEGGQENVEVVYVLIDIIVIVVFMVNVGIYKCVFFR